MKRLDMNHNKLKQKHEEECVNFLLLSSAGTKQTTILLSLSHSSADKVDNTMSNNRNDIKLQIFRTYKYEKFTRIRTSFGYHWKLRHFLMSNP